MRIRVCIDKEYKNWHINTYTHILTSTFPMQIGSYALTTCTFCRMVLNQWAKLLLQNSALFWLQIYYHWYPFLLFVVRPVYQASVAVMTTIRVVLLWIGAAAIVGLVQNNLHNIGVMILRRREWLFYAYCSFLFTLLSTNRPLLCTTTYGVQIICVYCIVQSDPCFLASSFSLLHCSSSSDAPLPLSRCLPSWL